VDRRVSVPEPFENVFRDALERQRAQGLYRALTPLENAPSKFVTRAVEGRPTRCLNFASNNYLDLAGHPLLRRRAAEALERAGAGSGGSRLLGGDLPLHAELEAALERYRPTMPGVSGESELRSRALLFNTGFQANYTLISALGEALGCVFADKLAHASVAEGLRVLPGPFHRFRHNDTEHLENLLRKHQPREGGLVVTETLFSMDGDFAPLEELCALQRKYGFWMLLDEAHSTGGYPGLHGRGLQGISERTILMGTFGKALGSFGAYVAGPPEIREYLVNFGRGLIYSTSLPPAVLGANLGALEALADPGEAWRAEALRKVSAFARETLKRRGFDTGASASRSHIVPVLLGTPENALRISEALARAGFHAPAVRPPTVPAGTSRLRLNLTAAFEEKDILDFVQALEKAC
jgi:8-amino-7-oxononanoate synthase